MTRNFSCKQKLNFMLLSSKFQMYLLREVLFLVFGFPESVVLAILPQFERETSYADVRLYLGVVLSFDHGLVHDSLCFCYFSFSGHDSDFRQLQVLVVVQISWGICLKTRFPFSSFNFKAADANEKKGELRINGYQQICNSP